MTRITKRDVDLPAQLDGSPAARSSDGDGLVGYLEDDQLVARTRRPLPRALLSRRAGAALWALRVFVIIVDAMVIYSFISALVG